MWSGQRALCPGPDSNTDFGLRWPKTRGKCSRAGGKKRTKKPSVIKLMSQNNVCSDCRPFGIMTHLRYWSDQRKFFVWSEALCSSNCIWSHWRALGSKWNNGSYLWPWLIEIIYSQATFSFSFLPIHFRMKTWKKYLQNILRHPQHLKRLLHSLVKRCREDTSVFFRAV